MTWNPGIPALANNISADYPDIKENLNELMLAVINRSQVTYNGGSSAATVKLAGGYYCCKDKFCYWASELTSTQAGSGTPTADTWYYLYLDYSAITSGTAITNAELIWSTTAPSWSHTYRGWYNGDDRCVFACLANATADDFLEFFHQNDHVLFAQSISLTSTGITTSWQDCTVTLPAFCVNGIVTFNTAGFGDMSAASRLSWRTNGQTNAIGHIIGTAFRTTADGVKYENYCTTQVITDSAQKIEVKTIDADTLSVTWYSEGWVIPIGM